MIYHITTKREWQLAQDSGEYYPKGFEQEGFIHCCKKEQVDGVLTRYFQNVENKVKLVINTDKLTNKLVYESSPSLNELFPHIYGYLNTDAVIEVIEI